MKLYSFSGLLAAHLLLTNICPALAQGYDSVNPSQQITNGALPNIGRAYSIRVTTGGRTNAGFEKGLTDGDPNLKHWTWVPVTSYDQGYIRVPAGSAINYHRPEHVYVKPTHVPLPNINHGLPIMPKPKPLVASAPATIPPAPKPRATGEVSGRVRFSKEQTRALIAETKSYGGAYGDVSGRIKPSVNAQSASSESTSVYGRLMTHTTR